MTQSHPSLIERGDTLRAAVFLAVLVLSVVVGAVLPFVEPRVTFYESFAAISAPFVALGVWDMLSKGRWVNLGASVLISVALCVLDWRYGAVAALLLIGSTGVAACVDLLSRACIFGILEAVEHGRVRPRPTFRDRLVLFMFDVPKGLDARNMMMNGTISRARTPFAQMLMSMLPGLVLMLFMWMFVTANVGFRSDVWDNALLALAVSMYIATLSLSTFSLATMDVRIEHAGATFRLFDGFMGTALRTAIPQIVALLILLYAADPGWNAVILIAVSGVFCFVLMLMTTAIRTMYDEPRYVRDVARGWGYTHPVDFYSGYDGRDRRHTLDDGVPGTPVRPPDSCFDPQRR